MGRKKSRSSQGDFDASDSAQAAEAFPRVLLVVGGGPDTSRAVTLIRRLRAQGARVEVVLGPEVEAFVPQRTFAVAAGVQGKRGEGEPGVIAAVAVGSSMLADLAAGCGWLFSRVENLASLLVLESTEVTHDSASWARGPRRALQDRGVRFVTYPTDDTVAAREILAHTTSRDLVGVSVLITAGPTREYLDPVRFLSNPSSGRMGIALASVAARRGARVELCLGPTACLPPVGVGVHRFESAEELDRLVQALGSEVDVVIAAAAVADWRPAERAVQKVKKVGDSQAVTFLRTPDVLGRLSQSLRESPSRPLFVGFAAETENLEVNARKKLVAKGLDLVVANRVDGAEGAFAGEEAEVTLVQAEAFEALPRLSKQALAMVVLDRVVSLLEVQDV